VRLLDDAVAAAAEELSGIPVIDEAPSGCTLTALLLGDNQIAIAHVGDSRAHLVRDGRLVRLTRDHTEVQTLLDEGRLTDDEARAQEGPALLNRALVQGMSAMPDISVHATRPGDRFILTTDGVHAVLQPAELAALLVQEVPPQEVVAAVEEAVQATGAPDNDAVLAIDVRGTD
jgi:PPM family protein phosphatase